MAAGLRPVKFRVFANLLYLYIGSKNLWQPAITVESFKFCRGVIKELAIFISKLSEMETLLVKLKHEKARKLLQDLEDLEILEVKEAYNDKKFRASKISDIKNKVTLRMSEEAINQQLSEIRNEWQSNI